MRKLIISSPSDFSHNYPNTMYEYEFEISKDIEVSSSTLKLRSFQSITNYNESDNFQSVPFQSLMKYDEGNKKWVTILPDTILHVSEIGGKYKGIISGGASNKKISLYIRIVDSRNLNTVLYSSKLHHVSTLNSMEILNKIQCDVLATRINIRNYIEYYGDLNTDYTITYSVTNNLNDDTPVWETIDSSIVNSMNFYMFNNRTVKKTPAIGVKTIITAKTSANGKVLKFKDIYIGYQ